jgi:uncharacterized repeat protein (TIGR02059 family)
MGRSGKGLARFISLTLIISLFLSGLTIFTSPPANATSSGSMSFAGTASSFLSIANDADLQFGTQDFTIEWWQNQTDTNSWPRVFSMGNYPAELGVSIEGGAFYFWNGSARYIANLSDYKDKWVHFAISRQSSILKVFRNGSQIGSNLTDTTNYSPVNALVIGNESTKSSGAAFGGKITNFHWLKGTAKYTSNFTAAQTQVVAQSGTNLLLNANTSSTFANDSSTKNKSVSNTGVIWSTDTPFSADTTAPALSLAVISSSGTSLILTYNETLSATTAATSAFTISNSGTAVTVSSVSASGSTVTLSLGSTIRMGGVVTVSYTDPTASNDANAIQDSAGNDAASFSSQSVTNNSTVAGPPAAPTLGTAIVTNATTISLPFTAGAANGSAITSYTITSSPSIPLTYSGITTPFTVTGSFVQGQAYTFAITASNAIGTSTSSSSSNSVRPYTASGSSPGAGCAPPYQSA